jgi:transcriptional regulator with XRE-family HTH domain
MVQGRKPNQARRQQVAQLRAGGLTLAEIGRRLGISHQAVHRLLKASGQKVELSAVFCRRCSAKIREHRLRGQPYGGVLCLDCLAWQPVASFGDRLRAFRLAAGLTQRELAQQIDTNQSVISLYERHVLVHPSRKRLAELTAVLGQDLLPGGFLG